MVTVLLGEIQNGLRTCYRVARPSCLMPMLSATLHQMRKARVDGFLHIVNGKQPCQSVQVGDSGIY